MIVNGKPLESMLDPQLMALLRSRGTVYLHGNANGWIVSDWPRPVHPDCPETIVLRFAKASVSGLRLGDVDLADLRRLADEDPKCCGMFAGRWLRHVG